MRLSALAVVGIVLLASDPLFGLRPMPLEPPATHIETTVIVTGRDGKFVSGLTATDFQVRENKRGLSLDTLSLSEVTGASPGIYLVYLSAVPGTHLARLREQAGEFVRTTMRAGDTIALFDDFAGDTVVISGDKNEMLARITGVGVPKNAADTVALSHRLNSKTTVDWLNTITGRRKALLLFTAGWMPCGFGDATMPYKGELERVLGALTPTMGMGSMIEPWQDRAPCQSSGSAAALSAFVALLQRSDTHIYTCDVRGVVTYSQALTPLSEYDPDASQGAAADRHAVKEGIENLHRLANVTGGLALVDSNDYTTGYRRIAEDNSRYYVLSYRFSNDSRDSYRSLDVRVKRPGLKVRARKGYFVQR
jgi:VWFA-related protein